MYFSEEDRPHLSYDCSNAMAILVSMANNVPLLNMAQSHSCKPLATLGTILYPTYDRLVGVHGPPCNL